MIQFEDGLFGPIEPAQQLLNRLAEAGTIGVKALHFGSLSELERLKESGAEQKQALAEPDQETTRRMDELEARVNALAMNQHTVGVRVYPADAIAVLPPPDNSRIEAAHRAIVDELYRACAQHHVMAPPTTYGIPWQEP